MRKFLISAAAAASALAVAAPAAAQWYPAPQPQYGYGYGHGYQNNWGMVRALQARINNLQRQIWNLDRRNIINNREARRLSNDARALERRLINASRNGLNPSERYNIERRIAQLEWRIQRDARDGRRWGWR